MWRQEPLQPFRGTALQTSPSLASSLTLCQGNSDLLFENHLSGVWIWQRSRKRGGREDTPLLCTRVFHNIPRATAKCIRPQHSQILLKSLHNSSSQAKKNRESRKQITVGKQEYLSLSTMALSNQRGRADEPLITCAITTSVSSIPWQAGSGWSSQGPVMFSSPQAWNRYEGPSPSWSQVSRHAPHRGCLQLLKAVKRKDNKNKQLFYQGVVTEWHGSTAKVFKAPILLFPDS